MESAWIWRVNKILYLARLQVCADTDSASLRQQTVSSSSVWSAISIKLIWIRLSQSEIKAAHKDKFINGQNFWNVSAAEYFRQDSATSAGASVQFEVNGSCTFIFQSNNQMTSPFSEALLSGGGRLQSQMQSVMHPRPIYCSDVPLPCDEGSPLLFAKLWSGSIQIKIRPRDGQRCDEADTNHWAQSNSVFVM